MYTNLVSFYCITTGAQLTDEAPTGEEHLELTTAHDAASWRAARELEAGRLCWARTVPVAPRTFAIGAVVDVNPTTRGGLFGARIAYDDGYVGRWRVRDYSERTEGYLLSRTLEPGGIGEVWIHWSRLTSAI